MMREINARKAFADNRLQQRKEGQLQGKLQRRKTDEST